jgi:uncharacterized protein YjbJ (UPF0337 family)
MDKDILKGQWNQIKGQIPVWWGRLTDDDVERIAGQWDKLVSLLQEKYGYTRTYAEEEINSRLREYEAQLSSVMPR